MPGAKIFPQQSMNTWQHYLTMCAKCFKNLDTLSNL